MTWFEKITAMNIDQLAEWLDKNGMFDDSPWVLWFDENYCSNCPSIMCHYPDSEHEFPCCWCELNDDKCKFFPDMEKAPDNKEILKMWLESEI